MRTIKKLKSKILQVLFKKKHKPLVIGSTSKLTSGKMSFHNGNFQLRGDQRCIIGNYCAFGKNISVITSNHDYNFASLQGTFYKLYFGSDHPGVLQDPPNKERTKGDVIIGNDVWIADNVVILSGVKIGNGACIGNSSIVTKDVAPYSIVGGIPAREIKKRFSVEKIEFLQDLAWWAWSENRIRKNEQFFMANLNQTDIMDLKKMIK